MNAALLEPLNDLAYLIECAALDYTGELKTELDRLCKALAGKYAHVPEAVNALSVLESALAAYAAGRSAEGASKLASVSRTWWAAVSR